MNSNIVVFAEDWLRHPSSSQHIVRQLAADNRVLWVNSIGLRRPRLNLRDLKRVGEKLLKMVMPRSAEQPGLTPSSVQVISPFAFPAPRSKALRWVNRVLLSWQVGRAMRKLGMTKANAWLALPTAVEVLGRLPFEQVVYYCGDDFGALAGVDHEQVEACEQRLVQQADHILVASERLRDKWHEQQEVLEKIAVLPHGVDFPLFVKPATPSGDLPSQRPIAGYYGSIAAWLDMDLLARVARLLPHWTFLFVGKIETDISRLDGIPNIQFVDAVPHHCLPGFSQHWTVSMLPFRRCSQIDACNPLKLREYLAAGRPVVSTPFPALQEYSGLVTTARGVEAFANALEESLQTPVSLLHRQSAFQRMAVRSESWAERAKFVGELLTRRQAPSQ
ncbi:glycosyltransferase [Aliagarivorans marinus]|uniref:glycosyltransferase n=1 Tax=Aliagarivorans marinus TaxID=561965 RepID=UPI0003FB91E3|nr:glycosyltransferase [Aliagarivorans marinus]